MKENFSINYFFASEAIRDLIFEEWEKFNILLQKGPEILKEYFCKLWNETKIELEYTDDIDIIDLERKVMPSDFNISYTILDNGMKAFNFIFPKTKEKSKQVLCSSVLITEQIPRYFTLEASLDKDEQTIYTITEWKIDFENNNYMHKKLNNLEEFNIGKYLGVINSIVQTKF